MSLTIPGLPSKRVRGPFHRDKQATLEQSKVFMRERPMHWRAWSDFTTRRLFVRRTPPIEVSCDMCGETFMAVNPAARSCSDHCSENLRLLRRGEVPMNRTVSVKRKRRAQPWD